MANVFVVVTEWRKDNYSDFEINHVCSVQVCANACVPTYVCIPTYMCVMCRHVCIYLHVCRCVCIYLHVCAHITYINTYALAYMRIYVYICIIYNKPIHTIMGKKRKFSVCKKNITKVKMSMVIDLIVALVIFIYFVSTYG